MNKGWYYAENGVKKGPFSKEELKGKISQETLLWSEGMAEWTKAIYLNEFAHFFEVTPPPIPDTDPNTSDVPKHFRRIIDSVFYGWALVILTAVVGIFEYTDNDEGRLYSLLLFLTLTSSIRVLIGLRSYLSNLLNFKKANININWMIGTLIPIWAAQMLLSKIDLSPQEDSVPLLIFIIIAITSVILYVFHSLRLAVKLFKVEDTAIGAIRTYAFLQILGFGFLFGLLVFSDAESDSILIETFMDLIPLIFLVIGLKRVRDKYVPKHAL